jgi:uncharacterized protein (DUF983 family)
MVRIVSDEEYLAAAADAAYDRFLEVAVQCAECGTLYDQKAHPATAFESAWAEQEECPNCGSGETRDRTAPNEGGG